MYKWVIFHQYKLEGLVIKSLRVLFPAPWGEKKMNKVPVEYPAFERNEKVER
jgi:hypothetical protein